MEYTKLFNTNAKVQIKYSTKIVVCQRLSASASTHLFGIKMKSWNPANYPLNNFNTCRSSETQLGRRISFRDTFTDILYIWLDLTINH